MIPALRMQLYLAWVQQQERTSVLIFSLLLQTCCRPILIVCSTIMFEPIIADNLTPNSVSFQMLHVECNEGILKHRFKHNYNKIFLRIIFFQVQTFEVTIVPFEIIAITNWIAFQKPLNMVP